MYSWLNSLHFPFPDVSSSRISCSQEKNVQRKRKPYLWYIGKINKEMGRNEAFLLMNLHLGPGVSISTPDVLMGSAEKLHSHGIVTALWTMRVICLALLPAVSPPPPHSCPPNTLGVDCWCTLTCHRVSKVGGRHATSPSFPSCISGMVCISWP